MSSTCKLKLRFSKDCDEKGFLHVKECPRGKLWDDENRNCVDFLEKCSPEETWIEQQSVDLEDCIGLVDGRCQLGFTGT